MRRILAVVCVAVALALGVAASSEFVGSALDCSPELGEPWLRLPERCFYAPWAIVGWSERLALQHPQIFNDAAALVAISAALGSVAALLTRLGRGAAVQATSHGSARWATTEEVRRAGLLSGAGVVLCQTNDAAFRTEVTRGKPSTHAVRFGEIVTHDGPEHVLCFAPTRSGKGVGLVIPTLLSWHHSVVVHDIKRENWALTAGWRSQFSHVWRFDPTSADSVRFNPLLEIRRGPFEVKDAQNVADILVDPTGEKSTKDHWQTTAHSLLCGAILHVLYAERDKTLSGVAAFLSDPERQQFDTLQRMLTAQHLPEGPHPLVAQVAREMLNKAERELSGVFSTALACLGLYRDPLIARSTSHSDFRIRDLMNATNPVSLYLVVPPSDLSRTRPLIRLVLNQIARRLTESMEFGGRTAYRHRLLLLLDEFPSLGRLDFFETALAFLAGYGVKALLIAQSLNQLEKAYGANNSILDNCHVRLTYAANDDKTARRISDLLGQATERKLQKSRSGAGFFLSNRSESDQEFARPLLTPGEVTQLSESDALLLVAGMPPYRARKLRYFLDPRFLGRGGLKAPDSPEAQARELLPAQPSEWALLPACSSGLESSALAGSQALDRTIASGTVVPAAAAPLLSEFFLGGTEGEGPASSGGLPL